MVTEKKFNDRTGEGSPAEAHEAPDGEKSSDHMSDVVDRLAAFGWSEPETCNAAWQKTPSVQGLYKWYLAGEMPDSFAWPGHLEAPTRGGLLYVGKAGNLRTRAKHHRLPTAGSTLRRTLASLFGYSAVWIGKSHNPRISSEHNELLSQWMTANLEMSFRAVPAEKALAEEELALRQATLAPFNKDYLTDAQKHVSEVGKLWRANAEDLRTVIVQ